MHSVNLTSLSVGFFIVCFYFCLALYAVFLSIMVGWRKFPYVTDQKLLGTIFLSVLAGTAYFLFLQNQWIGIVIIYLLFIIDLFLLWIVVPSEFRIICLEDDIAPLVTKVLLRINIPFEQKNNQFILLNRDQTLYVKKTFFKTYRIILEPGKERSLLKDIQKETKKVVTNDSPQIYKGGMQYLLGIGVGFLFFSGTLFYFFFTYYSNFYSM